VTAIDVEFDPFSSVFFDDPYETYRRLRDEAPIYHNEHYGFYAVSRWEDALEVHRDWATFSSNFGVDLSTLRKGQRAPMESIIMMDPPRHDRLRALVSRVFTPRAVTALEPMIREVIVGFLDELSGSFDAVAEFSAPFPIEIISRMLGVPEADRQQIRHWLDVGLSREPGQVDPTPEGMEAMMASGGYFYNLIQDKRQHPADDMLSRLTEVEVDQADGEGMTKLDDVEIAGFATLLGGAGAETVTKLVGNAVVLFDRNPSQWQAVRDEPGLIPQAVEEILRFWPPSQYQGRYSVQPWTRHDVTVPAGFPVLILTGAATRDPRAFEDPDRFDISRTPALALGLGYGIHSCLGAALARMESRIAIEELAKRFPSYHVDPDGLARVHMSNVAGYSNVPVTVG
jgi:cytochrome P450